MKITCPKCKYEWEYRGRLLAVTCPNCRHVFKRGKDESGK